MQRGRLRGAVAVATRAVAIVVVALLALPGAPGSLNVALAGDEFCANDPILSFDGQIVRIIAFVPRSALPLITEQNPIRYRVYVPQNVRAEVLGYTGEAPERVDFVQTGEIASGSSFTLRFEMIAPDRGAGTTYRG